MNQPVTGEYFTSHNFQIIKSLNSKLFFVEHSMHLNMPPCFYLQEAPFSRPLSFLSVHLHFCASPPSPLPSPSEPKQISALNFPLCRCHSLSPLSYASHQGIQHVSKSFTQAEKLVGSAAADNMLEMPGGTTQAKHI